MRIAVRNGRLAAISELRRHVRDGLTAYNFAKQIKAPRFKTQYEAVAEYWKSKPDIFIVTPNCHMLDLIPIRDERDSSGMGQARAAREHFQRVMRLHRSALV